MTSVLKGYKRVNAWGEKVLSSKLLTRKGYRSKCTIGTSVHPHTRFARNTQLRGNTCYVCCFLWSSTVNWPSLCFLWHLFAWVAMGRLLPTWEDWSTRQQWPPSLISADRGIQTLIWVSLIIHSAVTVLWHPGWAQKRAGRSKFDFIWLPIGWPLLRSVGPDLQCKTDRSVVQCSCPKLLLGKHLLGT